MTPNRKAVAHFKIARMRYHAALIKRGVLGKSKGIPSNADKSSKTSVAIAGRLLDQLKAELGDSSRLAGQIAGSQFEQLTRSFVEQTFSALRHLRPGHWDYPSQKRSISRFDQYSHLEELSRIADENSEIAAILGRDYIIAPDVIIVRHPEPDPNINSDGILVDDTVATRSSLREKNGVHPFLHASISCKWTLRSDRAQNARSEALNLVRARKGQLPHVVVVTGEPLPSRLASIALGTGDIDCVYHIALPELIAAAAGFDDASELLNMMIIGRRLKDISDLPLDLAV